MKNITLLLLFTLILFNTNYLIAQEEEEPILYYQMEPLDDSLFILIQQEMFIDPPDPKAEIVVDLRKWRSLRRIYSNLQVRGASKEQQEKEAIVRLFSKIKFTKSNSINPSTVFLQENQTN